MKTYIVRHVETIENKQGLMQGRIPGTVSGLGVLQATMLARRLKDTKFDTVYCSPLLRTRETAKRVMHYQICPIYYDEGLTERNFGILDGKTRELYFTYREVFKEENPSVIDFDMTIPGGESPREAQHRIVDCVNRIGDQNKGKKILIVTHGSVKRLLMMQYMGVPAEEYLAKYIDFRNGSISIVSHFDKSIEVLNEAGYLDNLEASYIPLEKVGYC